MYSNANMANTALAGAYLAEEDRKRREQESIPRQDNLLDTVGKIALAAGATAGAVVAGRRLTGGQNTSATYDLSQFTPKNLRRAAARIVAPQETVAPSRPAPTTSMERQRQAEEFQRQASSERMPRIVTTDLSQIQAKFPQAPVARDPWTGRETILDPFGPGTVPPVRRAEVQEGVQALPSGRLTKQELSSVLGDFPEPTQQELEQALGAPRQFVYRPQGGIQDLATSQEFADKLITDPRTGEIFRRGQSPTSFAETYVSLRPALTGQRTDLPTARTPGTFKEFSQAITESQPETTSNFASQYLQQAGYQEANTLVDQQTSKVLVNSDQAVNAVNSAEDQQTGRVKMAFQRNEDENLAAIEFAEDQVDAQLARMAQAAPETAGSIEVDAAINQVAAQRPDGMPLDQAENLTAYDLSKKESFQVTPRGLSQEQENDPLVEEARRYLRAREIDADYDYSAENLRQTAQVNERIKRAKELQTQANQILSELQSEPRPDLSQADPKTFAAAFNKQYREELSDQIRSVDNARQRAELAATEANEIAQDLESLLVGQRSPIDKNMRGRELRGGKPNAEGDIVYQDAAGNFASADTGTVKKRQKQGPEFKAKAEALNSLYTASDQELAYIIDRTRQARQNNQPLTELEDDTARMASQVLSKRAINNPEPTRLQLNELDRVTASLAASQNVIREVRNARPTISPGPAQDVARSMETLRRGMIVEPSEPLPVLPSVQQTRTGFVTDVDPDELKKMTKAERVQLLGPVLSASDVYTGAAAEAAGPVIFTGKSKANSVIRGPEIVGTVRTPVGSFQTQNNPDVLGTVYNVAGTPENRRIASQIESNAQRFLSDAVAGGLTAKAVSQVEPYRTPGTYGVQQFNLLTPPISERGLVPLQQSLGLTGPEASQRTGYAQYQPGRSVPARISPFIGEMSGGTVIATPQTTELPITRRDIGSPARSLDLTRRGTKSRYYNDDPAYPAYVTGMEPAPIGELTQSPGLSRIGGLYETPVLGAGNVPILELTTRGQNISYPRMAKARQVPTYKGYYEGSFYGPQGTISNIPRYGIDPGAPDWRNDLMRSAYRRGGPIRTYQA
jgi:hypothetical protein